MNKVAENYNKIYSDNKTVFGPEPSQFTKNLLKYISAGYVLDIGAGEGKNSIFLAENGFNVTAIDISRIAIEKISKLAEEKSLNIETEVADIKDFNFSHNYDVIIANLIFHHLSKDETLMIIKNIKSHTRSGGLNLINAITKEGDFYKDNPTTDKFFSSQGEIKSIYSDWEILEFQSRKWEAFQKRKDGSSMLNISEEIIVRNS